MNGLMDNKNSIQRLDGISQPLADQSAAMMIEDMRSFMQGAQQMITVAIAKATAMTLNETTAKTGKDALNSIESLMEKITKYGENVNDLASNIVNNFETGNSAPNSSLINNFETENPAEDISESPTDKEKKGFLKSIFKPSKKHE